MSKPGIEAIVARSSREMLGFSLAQEAVTVFSRYGDNRQTPPVPIHRVGMKLSTFITRDTDNSLAIRISGQIGSYTYTEEPIAIIAEGKIQSPLERRLGYPSIPTLHALLGLTEFIRSTYAGDTSPRGVSADTEEFLRQIPHMQRRGI